jgi:hypothetical protein
MYFKYTFIMDNYTCTLTTICEFGIIAVRQSLIRLFALFKFVRNGDMCELRCGTDDDTDDVFRSVCRACLAELS